MSITERPPWEDHTKAFRSTSDEVWNNSPICSTCGHMWPCDTAEAATEIEKLRATIAQVEQTLSEAGTDIETLTGVKFSMSPAQQKDRDEARQALIDALAEMEKLQAEKKADNERVMEIILSYNSTIKRLNEGYDKITAVMVELGFGTWTDPDDGTEWSLDD